MPTFCTGMCWFGIGGLIASFANQDPNRGPATFLIALAIFLLSGLLRSAYEVGKADSV